jgi:opacity protein-like surface antigen
LEEGRFVRNAVKVSMLALAPLLAIGSANAADFDPYYRERGWVEMLPYNWSGFYLGGNFGGTWSNGSLTDQATGANWNAGYSGFIGGGQLGFNYQISRLVIGGEWKFDWSSMSTMSPPINTAIGIQQASADMSWVSTLAGRVGIAADNVLFYGKVGGAWVGSDAKLANLTTGAAVATSNANTGWVAGVGVEYGFTPHWTARLEYDYIGLNGWQSAGPVVGQRFSVSRDLQMLTLGVNYKF